MPTYLLKTEPSEYSYADLVRDTHTTWSGVQNAQALQALRTMKVGDEAFIYHTGDEKAIVGIAKVIRAPYEDPEQPGKTPDGAPKCAVVDLKPVRSVKTPLTLAAIKGDKRFAKFALVTHARLSVMPIPDQLDVLIRALCGITK